MKALWKILTIILLTGTFPMFAVEYLFVPPNLRIRFVCLFRFLGFCASFHGYIRRIDEFNQFGTDSFDRENVIGTGLVHRSLGHFGGRSFSWVLHNTNSSSCSDGEKSTRPVIKIAAQQNSNGIRTKRPRRRPKQRIDGRTMAIFARSFSDLNRATRESQVIVGRRDIYVAWLNGLIVLRVTSPQTPGSGKNLRQRTFGLTGKVYDHKECSLEIRGQRRHNVNQTGQRTLRTANYDNFAKTLL